MSTQNLINNHQLIKLIQKPNNLIKKNQFLRDKIKSKQLSKQFKNNKFNIILILKRVKKLLLLIIMENEYLHCNNNVDIGDIGDNDNNKTEKKEAHSFRNYSSGNNS
jgi:hypothetical protein